MECKTNKKRKGISDENKRKLTKHTNGKRIESVVYPPPLCSSNPELPVDLVVVVLAMLPAATLQRFRCVCKSWDSLIREDRHLASLHLDCSRRRRCGTKKPGLVMLSVVRQWDIGCSYFFRTLSYSLEDDPTFRTLDLRELLLGGESFNITNSYNGLVGIYGADSFFILNPSIRKIKKLPRSSPHDWILHKMPAAGLGFDASTGEYKVVRLFHSRFGRCEMKCEVISFGGNETRSWRLIDDSPHFEFDDPPHFETFDNSLPVLVNGAIYWHLKMSRITGLVGISFDLRREKFGSVANGGLPDWIRSTHITELGGCLCVVLRQCYSLSLWVMKDPGCNSKWVKQYEIDLRNIYKQINDDRIHLEPLTFHNGKVVLHNGHGMMVYYDTRTERFSKQDQIAAKVNFDFKYASPYTESIVWPW